MVPYLLDFQVPASVLGGPGSEPPEAELEVVRHPGPTRRRPPEAAEELGHHLPQLRV